VGAQVLRTSGVLIRLATVRSRPGRWLRDAAAGALTRIPAVAQRAALTVSGVGVRYARPPGSDREAGRRAGDRGLREGRLHEALRGGAFVALADRRPDGLPDHVRWERPAEPVAAPVLVRPDGYVGWVGEVGDYPFWA